jgi:hypothetical protein
MAVAGRFAGQWSGRYVLASSPPPMTAELMGILEPAVGLEPTTC